jgi:hypothetical protein
MVGKLNRPAFFQCGTRLGVPGNFASGAQRLDGQTFITRKQATVAKSAVSIEQATPENILIKEAPVWPAG